MRVLVAEAVAEEGVELIRAQHQVDERHGLSRDELCAIIGDYDALIVRSQVQVDAELIAAGKRLVVIGRAVALRQSHASEPDRGGRQRVGAEVSLLHDPRVQDASS